MPNSTVLGLSHSPLFLERVKIRPFYGQNMVLTWSFKLLLPECYSVPWDVPCQISHSWVYPVAPFPRNGKNMALLWPKQSPHVVLLIGSP